MADMIKCPGCGTYRAATLVACRGCGATVAEAMGASAARVSAEPPPAPASITAAKQRTPNKTEQEYYDMYLAKRVAAGEITAPMYECITLLLADRCRYTPDWAYWEGAQLVCVECKGKHAWDDAIVKFKVAVEKYPLIVFIFAKRHGARRWEQRVNNQREDG